jgi:acyl-CoA synthetase (AMP-forming)/AMP-acid ligase II
VQWTEAGIPAPTYADEEDAIEGEICVRGENVFRGYVGGGVGGLAVRDGWLHTGDLGRRNADGTFEFAGLLKPMFTRNGFNIYPHEIENAVAAMPGVDGVTVRERPVDGAEPDIAVEVAGNVDADALKRWCAQRLSAYKQPTIISIL